MCKKYSFKNQVALLLWITVQGESQVVNRLLLRQQLHSPTYMHFLP